MLTYLKAEELTRCATSPAVQGGKDRAEYGDALIERLAGDLTMRFGRGFSRQNLQQMRSFYRGWPADAIRQTVSGNSFDLATLATRFTN
ncbi:MAG: DUF1016 N-terminal domain-containing protein [Sulfuriferula sp.]